MQYLTPSELRKIAPATQKMPRSDENLVDTRAFLRKIDKLGFQPVFAAQGTAHADADEPLKSRHFTVAADASGFSIAILNSHSIWRRAWIGAGFSLGNQFMIGAAVPLPRWKGFDEPLETVLSYRGLLVDARTALKEWEPDLGQRRWLTKQFAALAYLKGHKTPLPKALMASVTVPDMTAYAYLQALLLAARTGGLQPQPEDTTYTLRKLKPISAPDALLHAANRTFTVGLAGLRKYRDRNFAFPVYSNTR